MSHRGFLRGVTPYRGGSEMPGCGKTPFDPPLLRAKIGSYLPLVYTRGCVVSGRGGEGGGPK